jgi:CRP-like cAMP-binding protein
MPPDRNKALIQTINKIPFFKGLSPSQAQSVISICTPKAFAVDEIVCEGGTESNEMFIFLSGELGVVTPDGIQVATILPVTTVGEIGIATRQMRTATVRATKKSNLLVIKRVPLEQLLKSDAELLARIYRSLIEILAEKIVNDNIRIRDHLVAKVNGERRVKQQRRRVTLAMDLLEQKAGMDRGEIEAYLGGPHGGRGVRPRPRHATMRSRFGKSSLTHCRSLTWSRRKTGSKR